VSLVLEEDKERDQPQPGVGLGKGGEMMQSILLMEKGGRELTRLRLVTGQRRLGEESQKGPQVDPCARQRGGRLTSLQNSRTPTEKRLTNRAFEREHWRDRSFRKQLFKDQIWPIEARAKSGHL